MNKEKSARSGETVAALLLFAVFAIGVLSVLLGGAGLYRRINLRSDAAYGERTSAGYIMTKLRQAETPSSVSKSAFGDGDAIAIEQYLEGDRFVTYVYCHDGWLMELFVMDGGEFAPEDGERIIKASAIEVEEGDGLLLIELTDSEGDVCSLRYSIGAGEDEP